MRERKRKTYRKKKMKSEREIEQQTNNKPTGTCGINKKVGFGKYSLRKKTMKKQTNKTILF
jgi:hypothetical protein